MTHPSIHARTYPNKIAYQMAAPARRSPIANSTSFRTRARNCSARWAEGRRPHRVPDGKPPRLHGNLLGGAAQGLITAISRYLTQDEIAYIVKDCGAKVFITTPKCAEQVKGLVGQIGGPLLYMMDEPEPGFRFL